MPLPNKPLEHGVPDMVRVCDGRPQRGPDEATRAGVATPMRGWEWLHVDRVLRADTGADLGFLVGSSGSEVSRESH